MVMVQIPTEDSPSYGTLKKCVVEYKQGGDSTKDDPQSS